MILKEKFTLSNGVQIPKLGSGMWFIDEESVIQAVNDPVEIIERHMITLAIQIAGWAYNENPKQRYLKQIALPIFLNKIDSPLYFKMA